MQFLSEYVEILVIQLVHVTCETSCSTDIESNNIYSILITNIGIGVL